MHRIYTVVRIWLQNSADLLRISPLFRGLIFALIGISALLVLTGVFFAPKTLTFSFAQPTVCAQTSVLFPRMQSIQTADYTIEVSNHIKVFGYPLMARTVCAKPIAAPKATSSSVVVMALLPKGIMVKKISVLTTEYPSLTKQLSSYSVLSVSDPLIITLSRPDKTFSYALTANSKTAPCKPLKDAISFSCDPVPLNLKHATTYAIEINRVYNQRVVTPVSSAKIETVTPVTVVASSIAQQAVVYDKPQQILITIDKQIASVGDVVLKDDAGDTIATTIATKGSQLTVAYTSSLIRGKSYTLEISQIRSTDGGSLIEPYTLQFTPAKGPRVTGVNIGSSGVGWTQNIQINFDQKIEPADISRHLSLMVNGNPAGFSATAAGSTVTLNPSSDLAKCSRFTIATDASIASPYGVTGESAWSHSARATCFDSFSIGKSVQGRPIMAYKIGSGQAIVYVGGIHGNEQNATKIMQKWLSELDANPDKIPVNRSIIVIPSASPDAYARNSRTNANGINLNRNFPANNWKADVKEPSGKVLVNGGGVTALDQPESAALASFMQSLRPVMVMSYHSSGGVAVSNDAGNSRGLADAYAKKTGYTYKNNDTIGNFFDYDTTGAFEDWIHDKLNTPLILVELYSKYDDEFSRNKAGLWFIAQSTNF